VLAPTQIFFGDMAHKAEHVLVAAVSEDSELFAKAIGWDLVWSRDRGSSSSELHLWSPKSPSLEFVAVGHVCTTTAAPPTIVNDTFRLVHKALLCELRMCDHLVYKYSQWGGLGGVSTLWKSPPPWETIIAHASAEFPRGPFYALEPSMLPKELTIVQAEATFDYSPPSTTEYASCIHIKRGDKLTIVNYHKLSADDHWAQGYHDANPDVVGNILLQSVEILPNVFTHLIKRISVDS